VLGDGDGRGCLGAAGRFAAGNAGSDVSAVTNDADPGSQLGRRTGASCSAAPGLAGYLGARSKLFRNICVRKYCLLHDTTA
jgi:hypothetical protein